MADLRDIQKKIRDEFADRARNDTKLSEIRKKIQEGADYRIAEQYAERSGQILSEVLRSNITSENFPVGSVEEIAGLIIPPMEQNHHLVGNATAKVQKALNSKGNLGLKPVIPEFDRKAGMHMAGRMAQYESFEEAEWMLDEPIVTDSISQVDEMLHENADMQHKAGLRPKIIRTAEPGCCEWCASLAGEYDYEEVVDKGNPVYQRHNNCRCEVTWDPGSGIVQDVWSKAVFDKDSSKEDRVSAIRSKEVQLAKQEQTKAEERIKKAEATAKAMEFLGYSPKGASIWYNANKADIEKYGLEYMLDYSRNTSEDTVSRHLLQIQGYEVMTRRKIGERGSEVIDRPTYNKLIKEFVRREGVIRSDEEAVKHLDKLNAGAAYLPSLNTVLFHPDPTISEVLEEMFHAQQDRRNAFSNYPSDEILLRREIEAQEYLLSVSKRYKIPIEEQKLTEKNLADYKKDLEELMRWKNGV